MRTYKLRTKPILNSNQTVDSDGVIYTVERINSDGTVKQLPIDQFAGQPFMLNENGWIKNDIQAYEEAQSDSVARKILSRINVSQMDTKEDGLSLDDRLAEIIPSNYSSPAEFMRISRRLGELNYARQQAKLRESEKKESEDIIKFAAKDE